MFSQNVGEETPMTAKIRVRPKAGKTAKERKRIARVERWAFNCRRRAELAERIAAREASWQPLS